MRQMKDSGIEWIGQIPEEWEVRRLSTLISLESGCPISSNDISNEGLYPIFGGNGIRGYTNSYYIDGNFILIGRQGAQCGNIHYTLGKIWATEHALIVKSITEINKKFLYFLLISMNLNQYSTTAAQPGLSAANIRKKYICYPSLDEQQRIADYLDAQCARIDETMELVRQSREKLRAYKLSLITEAVTKGLDPDVPMKDSGVPWIGEIPAGWEIRKFATVVSVKANLVPPDNYPNLIQISPENIEKDSGKILHTNTVIDSGVTSSNHYFFKGQILYSKIRPSLNKVTIAPFDGLCSADIYPLESNINTEYTVYAMRSETFLAQVREVTELRVKMPKINQVELSKIIFCVPPLPEQQRIAAYLDEKCARIDALLAEKDELLDKLAEYKKSLIFECVTGKREVAA